MRKITFYVTIIFCFLVISCQEKMHSKKSSKELENFFTTEEIKDLNILVDYFESRIMVEGKSIEQCYKDWVLTNGRGSINLKFEDIEIFNFEDQKELYKKINPNTFHQIWSFNQLYLPRINDSLEVLNPNFDGKYLKFLDEFGKKQSKVKIYAENILLVNDLSEAYDIFLVLNQKEKKWHVKGDFTDYNNKLIITIATLNRVHNFIKMNERL